MKKLFFLLLLAFLSVTQAMAYDFEVGGIYYNVSGTNATVTYKDTNYNSYSGDKVIPETVTYGDVTYNVTQIGTDAFVNCTNLVSIDIPGSVTSIGRSAFYGCTNLKSVTILGNASLQTGVFGLCSSLESLTIPSMADVTLRELFGQQSFAGSYEVRMGYTYYIPSTLKKVRITGGTSIKETAFYGISSLTEIELPSSITSIGSRAFDGCSSLTGDIILSKGMQVVDERAFSGCSSLTSVRIPESVTSIAAQAFSGLLKSNKSQYSPKCHEHR